MLGVSCFHFLLRLTYPRLAAGVGSGNSTVDHACKIGRILGSATGNAIKMTAPVDFPWSKLHVMLQLSIGNCCFGNFGFDLRTLSM